MPSNYTNLSKDKSLKENEISNKIRTTDVNVLLNRVKLDKKQSLKKKILISFFLIGLLCIITTFLII